MNFNEKIELLINNIQLNIFHDYLTTKSNEQIDSCLINYLEIAHKILLTNKNIQKVKSYLKILLEYSWEKLNTGIWQNVKDIYRYIYAYACYIDVIADCKLLIENNKQDNYQVKKNRIQTNIYILF